MYSSCINHHKCKRNTINNWYLKFVSKTKMNKTITCIKHHISHRAAPANCVSSIQHVSLFLVVLYFVSCINAENSLTKAHSWHYPCVYHSLTPARFTLQLQIQESDTIPTGLFSNQTKINDFKK